MNIVILWEENLPFVDTVPLSAEQLQALLNIPAMADKIVRATVAELGDALRNRDNILVTVNGSAFPKAAWPMMLDFLRRGGNWVNIGGSPLSRPARRNKDGGWHVEVEQTAYARELRINQAFPIDFMFVGIESDPAERAPDEPDHWQWTDAPARRNPLPVPQMSRAWSLQVRFSDHKHFPNELGSAGTRDAVMRAQCYCTREDKRLAAPIVTIDWLRGPFAGGCWVLVNAELTEPLGPELLYALLMQAKIGPIELDVRPSFACLYPGETPAFSVRVKSHRTNDIAWFELALIDAPDKTPVGFDLTLTETPHFKQMTGDIFWNLPPGLHRVRARLVAQNGFIYHETETGFWVYDNELLVTGRPLTVNRDYFLRDGEPYPVMGTTYMSGDAHRYFLFEPNGAVWDRDFAEMKAAGVNMVRTGLWTAWRRVMLEPGVVDEGVLRAFTAFLLTARKYDIPVIFNFFAFMPEEWNGSNPYLDPRAVAAQTELVSAFAQRFEYGKDLIWDFINEPSFSSTSRIWSTRPNYDPYERAAWAEWLSERAQSFSAEEAQATNPDDVWRERWRLTPNMPLDLPAPADFQDQYIFQGTYPLRALDYRLFAQEMFNRWVCTMTNAVRHTGVSRPLVTVGQDEGGTGERPNPHFYADVVDFTTNHTWWQNDDLLWSAVMTKTPNRPNLIQETGIMFVENVDGSYRRTPDECANLLARKLTLAFAAGCAGAIQWLWNTNVYMDSDNEVAIGLLRADGTEKPELEVFRGIARLIWENRHRMVERELEEVAIVIPHSNMFSVRNLATAATRRAIRTLEIDMGVATRTVSKYRIEQLGNPKLIVLPSPRVLTQSCWEALLAKVESGATLLVTGPIDSDEYWRTVPRLNRLDPGLQCWIKPITPHDDLVIEGEPWHPLFFRGDKMHKVDKAELSGERVGRPHESDAHGKPVSREDQWHLIEIPCGQGKLLYFRFPAELADDGGGTLMRIYWQACRKAGVSVVEEPRLGRNGFYAIPLVFRDVIYYLFVGETGSGGGTHIMQGDATVSFFTPDGDDGSIYIANRATGKVLDAYPGSERPNQ